MKGQFFILGALIIILLLYTGLAISRPLISQPEVDLGLFFANMNTEYPKALNFGLELGNIEGTLRDYTWFLDDVMTRRFINLTAIWIVLEGDGTQDVDVTIGNYLKRDTTVSIDIPGTTGANLPVAFNSTATTTIGSVSDTVFNVTIAFESLNQTIEWHRDKANLFVFYRLLRGSDFVQNEIIA